MKLLLFLCALASAFAQMSPELKLRIQEALCEVQCLKVKNSCSTLSCDMCTEQVNVEEVEHHHSLPSPEFLCRNQDKLGFIWNVEEPMIFIIELKTENSSWSYLNKTSCANIRIDHLAKVTNYQIRLWGVSRNAIFGPSTSSQIRTSSKAEEIAAKINISPHHVFYLENNYYTVTIKWNSTDPGCLYDVVYFTLDTYQLISVRDVNNLFQTNISGLEMGQDIILQISNIPEPEDWKNRTEFKVPTCIDTYKSLDFCPPLEPADLQITDESVNNDSETFNIKISWSAPELQPDNYTIQVVLTNSTLSKNIPGNETVIVFEELPLPENSYYFVNVIARSKAGSTKLYKENHLKLHKIAEAVSSTSQSSSMHLPIFVSIGCVLVVLVLILAVLYGYHRLKKKNQNVITNYYGNEFKSPPSPNLTTDYYIPEVIDDEWQLDYDQITFEEYLDEGAFGIVHKGLLKYKDGRQIEVAIKTLKGIS